MISTKGKKNFNVLSFLKKSTYDKLRQVNYICSATSTLIAMLQLQYEVKKTVNEMLQKLNTNLRMGCSTAC